MDIITRLSCVCGYRSRRDFWLTASVVLLLGMLFAGEFFGAIRALCVVPVLAIASILGFELLVIVMMLLSAVVCAFFSPQVSLFFIVYCSGFSIVMSSYLNFAKVKNYGRGSSDEITVSRVILSFFFSSVVALFLVGAFFETSVVGKMPPLEFVWCYYLCDCSIGVGALVICLVSFVFLEIAQRVGSGSVVDSPFAFFSPSEADYYAVAGCVLGSTILSGDDSLVFANAGAVALAPFFIDGGRALIKKIGVGRSYGKIFIWVSCFVCVVPIVVMAVCSFFQPWLKWRRWSVGGRVCHGND
ncbi:hypothetical protein [Candidatus Hydrogenosomobacter endosymbioticus]|nr:hypothetical protein [Candidatus Hydrogenosomobacter endosymbioticus]